MAAQESFGSPQPPVPPVPETLEAIAFGRVLAKCALRSRKVRERYGYPSEIFLATMPDTGRGTAQVCLRLPNPAAVAQTARTMTPGTTDRFAALPVSVSADDAWPRSVRPCRVSRACAVLFPGTWDAVLFGSVQTER